MRHAKAQQVAASDHDRRLTERGVREATEAGRWARASGILPDHVIVSTASRAHETWESFKAGAELEVEAELVPALYSAGTDGAIEVLRSAPEDAATVMVVGHNPTMEHLVHLLDDGTADPDVFAAISSGFPTSAIAVLEVRGSWSGLDIAGARLAAVHLKHS